jgi:CRP-like cAMP-binding protein
MTPTPDRRLENRLLTRFPAAELEPLRPHMEQVSLSHGDRIIVPDEPIRHVYFPLNSLLSMVTVMEDGAMVECSSIGREGMSGLPVLLEAGTTPMQTLVQIPGEAIRVEVKAFKRAYDEGREIQNILNRHVHVVIVIAAQSAACNRLHLVESRLCRWLLMCADGIGSNEINITHEYLAAMLGVRRASVSEVASRLQDAKLIRYQRGNIQIIDRENLKASACECYGVARAEIERLLGQN